jgi:hypothetical protein
MEKIVILLSLCFVILFADTALQNECLQCHQEQQIPSNLIYKRYLLKYSTNKTIADAIYSYIKNPKKEHSIMPLQFFLKFPMKKPLAIDDVRLRHNITAYINRYDIKKKLHVK